MPTAVAPPVARRVAAALAVVRAGRQAAAARGAPRDAVTPGELRAAEAMQAGLVVAKAAAVAAATAVTPAARRVPAVAGAERTAARAARAAAALQKSP